MSMRCHVVIRPISVCRVLGGVYCVQTYRLYVLYKLPQLHDLDMTTVTEGDREQVAVLRRSIPVRTKKTN